MYKKEKKEHGFKTFSKDIKEGNIPGVIFLYGVEGYLIGWAVESLVKRYVNPACMALDYIRFYDEGEDASSILDACDTFSMISEKRIVWAREFGPLCSSSSKGFSSADMEKIKAYIKEPNPATLLIFSAEKPDEKSELSKWLKKECKCYELAPLDYSTLNGFIQKRFAAAGREITRDLIKVIIDQSGYFNKETEYRIYNLIWDIEKIIAYSSDAVITEEDVCQVLTGDMDKFIFNLLDAVSSNQKDKAFALLYNILNSGRDVFSVVAMLVNQFELLLDVAEFKGDGMNLSQISATMKTSEFRIKKAMAFTEKFTVDKLRSILSQLYEIDRNIKMGLMEQTLALEMLIGRI